MLGKFSDRKEIWIPALLAHCGVHYLFTFCISYVFSQNLGLSSLLALLDLSIHFVMDRIKASSKLMGRWKSLSANEMANIMSYKDTVGLDKFKAQLKGNTYFWWALGFDQMIYHLTDILVVYLICNS